MAIDATVGGESSNSYLTVAEATTYFGNRLYTTDWDDATTANREKALIWSTALLDQHVNWVGRKKDDDQALRWPRQSVYDRDGYYVVDTIIPQVVKDATAEMALSLLTENRTADPDTAGLKSLKVESIALDFDSSDRDMIGVIPDTVVKMLEPTWGTVRAPVATSAKLVRT